MALRYYDVLEGLYRQLDDWRVNDRFTKTDVLDSVRESVLILMTHVITTPLIGTAYAYPGDMQGLDAWLADTNQTNTNGAGDAGAAKPS